AEHAYSRERCESENSQRSHLGLDAEVQRDDLVVDDTEELLLEVGASPPARLDRIVAVQLIAADDAVDARAVRDPRAALLAVILVIEEPCSDAAVRAADLLSVRGDGGEAEQRSGDPTHP